MKKLIFVIVLLIGLNIKVNANSVIVFEEKLGSIKDLQIEGSKLLTTDINFNEPGVYNLSYYDGYDGKIYNRELHIVSSDSDYTYRFTKELLNVNLDKTYIIEDFLLYNDYLIISGQRDLNERQVQTEFIQNYAFINCYKDGTLLWAHEYSEYSYINKMVITKGGILSFVTYQNDGDYTDIKLVEYSFSGQILREKIFIGNSYEMGIDLIESDKYYYILYYTYSNSGDFISPYKDTKVISISKLDKITLNIIQSRYIGNNNYNYIIDYAYDDFSKKFFIVADLSGSFGNYQGKNLYNGQFIIAFDDDLNNEIYTSLKFETYLNGICASDGLVILTGRNILNNNYIYNFFMDTNLNIIDYNDYKLLDDIVYSNGVKEVNQSPIIKLINRNGEVCGLYDYNFNEYYKLDSNIKLVKYIDKTRYLLKRSGGQVVIYKDYFIGKRSKDSTVYDNIKYNYQEFWVNDIYISSYSYENYNKTFGHYKDIIRLEDSNFCFVYGYQYFVREKFNIKNNQVYDKKLKLIFNGVGYLNDELIYSGYEINNVGFYNLVIYGNESLKSINFKVESLSVNNIDFIDKSIEIKNANLKVNPIQTKTIQFEKTIYDISKPKPQLVYSVIVLIFIGIGFLMPIRWRKK